jgi:hypothetical protein
MIDKSVRDLERERTQLQRQEQKILVEIKKSAKANQMVPHGSWRRHAPHDRGSSLFSGCLAGGGEDHGKGPGSHAQLDKQVLRDEDPTPGRGVAAAGKRSSSG